MPLSPIFLVFPSYIFFCPVSCKALCHHGFFWPCSCINYSPTAPFFFYNNNFLIKTCQASYGSSDNNSIIDWQKCMPIFQNFKTKKIVSIITVRYCLQKRTYYRSHNISMFSLNIKHPTTCWRSHAKPACYTVQLKWCEDKLFFLCQNCISFFWKKLKCIIG